MFFKNNLWIGLAIGIAFPLGAWVLLGELNKFLIGGPASNGLSQEFLAIIAVASNLLPFYIFNRRDFDKSMQGVVFATIGAGITVMAFFWDSFMTK